MTSHTWRALGQVVIVYFAINCSALTAQDLQPGRATFAEMVAFARLASVPCKRSLKGVPSRRVYGLRGNRTDAMPPGFLQSENLGGPKAADQSGRI